MNPVGWTPFCLGRGRSRESIASSFPYSCSGRPTFGHSLPKAPSSLYRFAPALKGPSMSACLSPVRRNAAGRWHNCSEPKGGDRISRLLDRIRAPKSGSHCHHQLCPPRPFAKQRRAGSQSGVISNDPQAIAHCFWGISKARVVRRLQSFELA
jgi:hypothetical protein